MAERILVPLDGSKQGEDALAYLNTMISNLCPEKKVTVTLLHIVFVPKVPLNAYYDLDMYGSSSILEPYSSEETIDELKKKSQLYLARAAKIISSEWVEVKTEVVDGSEPAEEILRKEKELYCDLVVMSTHGRSGLSRWAFGSVTDKVLRAGTVPVLMVRTLEQKEKTGS
jgi:nucleotide-binding universal stress UspA family protein